MTNKPIDNAKLGLLVIGGLCFMILTLYLIGINRNLLGSTFTFKVLTSNVNGLVPGNNVRFKGIDVGTVKSIDFANDSAIYITLTVDKGYKRFIKKNAIASVGTDGLMGNRLLNINSQSPDAAPIEEGETILALSPVETDEMLRTLNTTNKNIERITANLVVITNKLNASNSLWTLLADTTLTEDLRGAVKGFRRAGNNTADATETLKEMVAAYKNSDGLASHLFFDTTFVRELATSIQQLQVATTNSAKLMADLKVLSENMKQGEGTAGLVIMDTTLRNSLMKSMKSVEEGTSRFNENMEAMRSNFLFRGYFKKQEKEKKKAANHPTSSDATHVSAPK